MFVKIELCVIEFGRGRLSNDVIGFEHLAELHYKILASSSKSISIDLSQVTWFDAHLCAPLSIIVKHCSQQGKSIYFVNIPPRIETILCKNKFLRRERLDNFGTTMPVQLFHSDHGVQFSNYAKKHLGRKEVPTMSDNLKSRFFEGVDELFANSALHSKTPTPIVVSGQFFPNVNRLDFAIADGGRGFQGSLRDALGINMPADRAIDWAMTPNNTTRQGDIPGGLGSKVLREFIEINQGKLIVVSNNGIWKQTGKKVTKERMSFSFPGTFVILEINTADQRAYDLKPAPDPRDIW